MPTEYRISKDGKRYPVSPWLKLVTPQKLLSMSGPLVVRFRKLRIEHGLIRGQL